jgi:hypothetical protein
MKVALSTTLATLAIIVGSTRLCVASDIVVSSTPYTPAVSPYQRAVSACVSSFMGKIMPGNTTPVRTAFAPSIHESDFSLGGYFVPIDVTLTARSARNGGLLAQSECQVDRFAKVRNLSLTASDPAKLAGLSVKDLRVAAVGH